jgi:hypothetical protein
MRPYRLRLPRRDTVRRLIQLVLPGLAWSITPHFVPRCLPCPDDGPETREPAASPVEEPAPAEVRRAAQIFREPRPCVLSRAERRQWAEIEAHYH